MPCTSFASQSRRRQHLRTTIPPAYTMHSHHVSVHPLQQILALPAFRSLERRSEHPLHIEVGPDPENILFLLSRGLWQQMQGPRASQTGSWGLASSQCGKKPPKHRDGTAGRCSFMIDPVFVAFASGTRLRYACRRTSRRNESGLLLGAAVVWARIKKRNGTPCRRVSKGV
jgi:hypothetical protein